MPVDGSSYSLLIPNSSPMDVAQSLKKGAGKIRDQKKDAKPLSANQGSSDNVSGNEGSSDNVSGSYGNGINWNALGYGQSYGSNSSDSSDEE